jgi:aminopeptidase N
LDLLNPVYKSRVRAVQSSLAVMDRDSSPSARPLSRSADSTQDVKGIADGIIFSKGAAIPLMFENYIGESEFQKFIRYYVKKHKFSNASSEDFLKALEETSGKEVASSFRSFLFQPGVPFLQLETKCEDGKSSVRVHHSRYAPLGVESSGASSWKIPACFRFDDGTAVERKCAILAQDQTVPLSDRGCLSWMMPDANGTGYYRWTLSPEGWNDLRAAEKGHLSIQEELSVVDSILAAFDSGRLLANEALKSLAPYASSDVREIAMAPSKLVIFLKEYVAAKNQMETLEQLAQSLYAPTYRKFGFDKTEKDSEEIRQFRSDVIDFLAFYARDPQIRKEAAKRGIAYTGYQNDGRIHEDAVDANLIETVLGVAVQENGADYLNALVVLLRNSSDSVLRSRILSALGRVTAPEQVKEVLALSLSPDLKTNEVLSPAESLLEEASNRELVWKWLQENYDSLISRLSPTDAGSLPLLGTVLCSDSQVNEVKAFFEPKIESLPSGSRNLHRAIDQIILCSAKRKAHQNDSMSVQ